MRIVMMNPLRHHGVASCNKYFIILAVLFCLAALHLTDVSAATITVNTLADEQNINGSCSLREAIINANNDDQSGSLDCPAGSGIDTISFGLNGTITLTSGEITINSNLTISGPGAASLAISGNNASRIFSILSGTIVISNVTVQNGSVPSVNSGGAIYISNPNVVLTINNCIISNNHADATYSDGGAIFASPSGDLTINNSVFSGNSAGDEGGAIWYDDQNGKLTISGSTFSDNIATNGDGGAIEFIPPSAAGERTFSVTDTTFSNNHANLEGGAVYICCSDNTVTISGSTFSGNTAGDDGGGLYNCCGASASHGASTVTITNSTFFGNTATVWYGGGITAEGPVVLDSVTMNGNSAPVRVGGGGGGIYTDMPGFSTLRNTIIANSTSGGNCAGSPVTSLGYNLSSDNSCSFSGTGDMNSTNPLLGVLADNGGPTQTLALLSGSPAVNMIPNGVNGCGTTITGDQRGIPRPQPSGGLCDIGAFEAGPTMCTPAPAGLVSWWPGDEYTSDIISGNNGIFVGSTTYDSGKVGKAFSFDGGSNYVFVPDTLNIDGGTQATYEAWVLPRSTPAGTSYYGIFGAGDTTQPTWTTQQCRLLYKRTEDSPPNTAKFYIDCGTNNTSTYVSRYTSQDYPINNWYSVAGVFNNGSLDIYVNGILDNGDAEGITQDSFINTDADNYIWIGAAVRYDQSSASMHFDGLIDEVEIFNRALGAEEISEIYNAGSWGKCRPCTLPPSDLVSWWPGDGDPSDIIGGNNGNLQGGATYAQGKAGQAFSFDEDGDYLKVNSSESLNVGMADGITIDAWIKPNNVSIQQPLIEWRTDATIGAHFWIAVGAPGNGPGSLYANIIDTDGGWHIIASNSDILVPNKFQHVALTYDKTTGMGVLYLNGQAVRTDEDMGTFTPKTSLDLYVGYRSDENLHYYYQGLIDEVEIFNRALRADEILSIYNAGSGGKCKTCITPPSDMVGWWPGDDNTSDIIGGNNGTLVDDATFAPGKVGQAFSFDGVGDYVITPDLRSYFSDESVTIELWFNATGPGVIVDELGQTSINTGWHDSQIEILSTGEVKVRVWTLDPVSIGTVAFGTWHHAALRYNKTTLTLDGFLDGVEAASDIIGDRKAPWESGYTNALHYAFGAADTLTNLGSGYYFEGLIDEVEIFNRALSAEEIRAIYNAGLWGKCKGTDLSITKSAEPESANTNEPLTYTLNVSNLGPGAATSVIVTDTLPAGVNFDYATGEGWSCNIEEGVVTCTRDSLAVGDAPPITINVIPAQTTNQITNTATVTSSTFDLNPENNSAVSETEVLPIDLSIMKTDSPDPVVVGGALTYTILVTNNGPGNAYSVHLNESLPDGTAFVSADSTQGTCTYLVDTVACNIGEMANSDQVTVTIVLTAPDKAGDITNTATVSCLGNDPNPENNSAVAETEVLPHTITATAGPNGTISPVGTINANHGVNRQFTITPDPNYHIADVLVDGVSVGSVSTYTFLNIKDSHTIHAIFAINTYTITATAGPDGTISPAGEVSIDHGADQVFMINPDDGYSVEHVWVDGKVVGRMRIYTFFSVVANHTIHVSFKRNTFTITAEAGLKGSVTPAGITTLSEGESQNYIITPNAGYHVSEVLVDGVSVGQVNAYAFNNVTGDHTLNASFAINTYTITATAGPNGNISPSGAVTVNHGEDKTFIITPADGYEVFEVFVDGVLTDDIETFTFTNVESDHNIHADFSEVSVNYFSIDLPRTGQDRSYSNGDDGAIQAGVIWPIPRYTNPDGATPISDQTVLDQLTGLIWTIDGTAPGQVSCLPGDRKTWSEALNYISCLNVNQYLGYVDWRLPNVNELESHIHAGEKDTAQWLFEQGFVNVQANNYWSSTTFADNTGEAWTVNLSDGTVMGEDKAGQSHYVWPVRGVTTGPALLWKTGQDISYLTGDDGDLGKGVMCQEPRFTSGTEDEQDCVTDNLTGLMWARNPDNTLRKWKKAIDFSNRLTLCGYQDWRLSNRKEIRSLINYGEKDNASWLNEQGFVGLQSDTYWTSTTCASMDDCSWAIHMGTGELTESGKDSTYFVLPVRSVLPITVTPSEGTIGTEIIIQGADFGEKRGSVYIGDKSIKVKEWNPDMIRCLLNKPMAPGIYPLTVQTKQLKRKFPIIKKNAFEVKSPKIETVNPSGGRASEEVTITGWYFGTNPKVCLEYQVNGRQRRKCCRVIDWSMDKTSGASQIRFVVPKRAHTGEYSIRVKNRVGQDTAGFTIID